jgi:hypothetical protein
MQLFTGFLFGTSLSVGLGLNFIATMTIGVLSAIGVLVSGSFISYLTADRASDYGSEGWGFESLQAHFK